MWRTKMYLTTIALGMLLGVATCNEGPDAVLQEKSPVYFPIIPADFKNYGIKLGGGGGGGGGGSAHPTDLRPGKKLDMPVTTVKPTTTTDKLPINSEGVISHVALETVTELPGPSYLTDSYYYLDDHTPAPGSDEDSAEGHGHGDIATLLDRESESFGAQALQNLAPVRPKSFGEKTPTALALLGPEPTRTPSRPSNRVAARYTTPQPPPPPPTRAPTRVYSTTPQPPPPTRAPTRVYSTTPQPPPPPPTRAPTRVYSTTRRPAPTTTTRRPAPTTTTSPRYTDKNMKLRPAYTPIPTPAPIPTRSPKTYTTSRSVARPSTRVPSRITSRVPRPSPSPKPTSKPTPITNAPERSYNRPDRVSSRRPKFESSRISISKPQGPSPTVRRPTLTPKTSYRTPSPPTVYTTPKPTTTTTSRTFGERAPSASSPRRQYLSAVTNSPGESPVYRTSTKAYRAPSSLFHVRGATTTVTAPAQPDFVQSDPNIYVPLEYDEDAIPGEAGVDYPNYRTVPETSFTCNAQEHPGLYADPDAQCQTFHICQDDGRQDSFLCPNGTVFNQQYFVCDWWYNFSCDHADRFYSLNAFIYELPDSTKYERK